jgi:hypothetical protein
MRFHEYRTFWSEMQGRLLPQVTEEMSGRAIPKVVPRRGSVVHRDKHREGSEWVRGRAVMTIGRVATPRTRRRPQEARDCVLAMNLAPGAQTGSRQSTQCDSRIGARGEHNPALNFNHRYNGA